MVSIASAATNTANPAVENQARLGGEAASALASICYYFEMQPYTDKGVIQNLLQRPITNSDTVVFARLHELDCMQQYPLPVSFERMEVDLFTYCDFNALTEDEQAVILKNAKAVADLAESR